MGSLPTNADLVTNGQLRLRSTTRRQGRTDLFSHRRRSGERYAGRPAQASLGAPASACDDISYGNSWRGGWRYAAGIAGLAMMPGSAYYRVRSLSAMPEPNNYSNSPPGAWVFVSHSNTDIAGVRAFRDELERMGHYPLLFFLKCISADDELDGLIKRGIEARNFFLLCDSPSARESAWVQREVEHIQSLPHRVWRRMN